MKHRSSKFKPRQLFGHARRAEWKGRAVRALGRCDYCDCDLVFATATVDHIVPSSRGGPDEPVNWAIACQRCQDRKANHLLAECGMALVRRRVWGEIPTPAARPPGVAGVPPMPPQPDHVRRAWQDLHLSLCPWCDYCGVPLTADTARVDLVVPANQGGQDRHKNWALTCPPCAERKAGKALADLNLKLHRVRGARSVHDSDRDRRWSRTGS